MFGYMLQQEKQFSGSVPSGCVLLMEAMISLGEMQCGFTSVQMQDLMEDGATILKDIA